MLKNCRIHVWDDEGVESYAGQIIIDDGDIIRVCQFNTDDPDYIYSGKAADADRTHFDLSAEDGEVCTLHRFKDGTSLVGTWRFGANTGAWLVEILD